MDVSAQASEEGLLKALETTPREDHDSIYYELFRGELYNNGDLRKANYFALRSYNESKKSNHPFIVAKSSRALGMINIKLANSDSAVIYYHTSISISKINGFLDLLVYATNDLGLFYENQGRYDSALWYYQISLENAMKVGLKEDMAFTLNNIGVNFYHLGNYRDAIKNIEAAIKIKKEEKINSIHKSLMNLALVRNDQGHYCDALKLLEKIKKLYLDSFDDYLLAELYADFGYSYFHLCEYEQAKSYYLESLCYAQKSKNYKSEAGTLHYLGLISIIENRYRQAEVHLSSSLNIATAFNLKRTIRDVYEAFYNLNKMQGNFEMADKYQQKFLLIKDSIFNGTVAASLSHIQMEAQKKVLDSIIKDKESKIQTFQITTILIGVIVILLITVSVLLFLGFRTRGRMNKILEVKVQERTKELVVQNKELNTRTFEQRSINTRLESKVKALTATLNGLKQVIKKESSRADEPEIDKK